MASTIQVDTIKDIGGNTMISSNGSGTFTNSLPAPTSGIAASAIDSGTIATARLGSGTASSSTFLRGDQTYAAAGGGDNTPYFRADTTTQTVGGNTVLIFTNSVFDSASGYSTSTGKYTIPSGQSGYWWFQANATIGASYTGMYFNIRVGGTNKLRGVTANASLGTTHCSGILNVSAGNEITVALELGSSQALAGTAYLNSFSGYKLIT